MTNDSPLKKYAPSTIPPFVSKDGAKGEAREGELEKGDHGKGGFEVGGVIKEDEEWDGGVTGGIGGEDFGGGFQRDRRFTQVLKGKERGGGGGLGEGCGGWY